MTNIIQYGAIFKAAGYELNLRSKSGVLEVTGNISSIGAAAIEDISKYENTANFSDGLAAAFLADTIDEEVNPLPNNIRNNILVALNIMKDGKFISQVIGQQKTNRSWHTSSEPNTCTAFGALCTNRGIVNVPGKRGRKSNRKPEDYHPANSTGIAREQLVTPAVEALVGSIHPAKLISISGVIGGGNSGINLESLNSEQLQELLAKINSMRESVGEMV